MERLWTPWRMRYVSGEHLPPDVCVFCDLPASDYDVDNLIVARGEHVYVVMNLFPYNTGHLLIVPYAHVSSLEDMSLDALTELMAVTQECLGAIRLALGNEGFNVGFNLGDVAGAGIASHVHQHIVPRWKGDANFMPLIGGVKVIPELIPATYAKIRAEISRRNNPAAEVRVIGFDHSGERVLFRTDTPGLPVVKAGVEAEGPVWRQAFQIVASSATEIELAGWGGSRAASEREQPGFTFLATPAKPDGDHRWIPVHEALGRLPEPDRNDLEEAHTRVFQREHRPGDSD